MIITMSALATPITEFPFPAVTVCNMNQAKKSAVLRMPLDSKDYGMIESLCTQAPDGNATDPMSGKWKQFKRLLLKVIASAYSKRNNSSKNMFHFVN